MRGSQASLLEAVPHVDLIGAFGSAGSGKSEGALGAALLLPSSCRLVRGTAGELTDGLLRRAAAIVGNVDGRNLSESRWEIPPPYGREGVVLSWTGLNDEGARAEGPGT